MNPVLSKSQYMRGLQCPKALWLDRHRMDLKPETGPATQARFDAGHEIGQLAQQYFEGGVEVTNDYRDVAGAVHTTQKFIKNGHEIVFEATALHLVDGGYARIDILRKIPGTDEWELIEVKGATGVKDYHIDDMSFQYHVFNGAGYKIRRCLMMLINNEYVRDNDIDLQRLFKFEDISQEVFVLQETVSYLAGQLG